MQSEIQENYKVFDFCLESVRACMCVSLQTCQAVDHSFPPLALSPSSHTIFFFSTPQTQGFPWEARVGAWFTVQWNYGTGRLPNTRWLMGGFASLPRWWRGCFTSPADGDDLSFFFFLKGWSSDVRGFDMRCRLHGDQSVGRPSRAAEGQFLTPEEKEK